MQLKRNEIKIETLKRSHKKEIIIGVLGVLGIVATITMTTSKAKYRTTQILPLVEGEITYTPYDFKIMAMYKSDDGVNYTEITDRMPSSGYAINESKSYCTIDNVNHDTEVVLKTVDGNHVFNNLTKLDKCYIWFDVKKTTTSDIIAKLDKTASSSTPTFSNIATTDEGVYKTADGMYGGTTYYWRGATTTNHVIFANKCWRIVRINGDKTMRLIYNGDVQSGNTCTENGANSSAVIFSDTTESKVSNLNRYAKTGNDFDNSSYVGWTYSLGSQRTLSGTSSNAKTQTEKWYSSNITGTNAEKVADGKFCNDRNTGTPPSSWSGYTSTWSATGTQFAYAGVDRLLNKYQPTLACNTGDTYTLKVGAITADEVMYAGGNYDSGNISYYLYTGQNYWTMSPSDWGGTYAIVFYVNSSGSLYRGYVSWFEAGLRPVINLKADTKFATWGEGTTSKPYIVQ